jgi:hypothetical protein
MMFPMVILASPVQDQNIQTLNASPQACHTQYMQDHEGLVAP